MPDDRSRPRIAYTGLDLERADALRKNPQWLREQLNRGQVSLLPMWRDRHFVREDGETLVALSGAVTPLNGEVELNFLGLREGIPLFAGDLSALSQEEALAQAGEGRFLDLRELVLTLDHADAALLAYARSLLCWHRTHRYCATCGGPTGSRRGGHMRLCLHEECGREWFPAISPAVIMLVERPAPDGTPRCLLARHGALPQGVYTTIAGFVDVGESLEETVIREVREETGIEAGHVTYRGSQPWAFSSALMLAFRAQGLTEEITVDGEELQEARWFTADEVRGFGDWHDTKAPLRLPRRDSISRVLIDTWLEERR